MSDRHERMTTIQVVCFLIGKETFGVDISSVTEIVKPQEITSVPGTTGSLLGVFNLRGRITSVVDLARRLGLTSRGIRPSSRIIVVSMGGATTGFIVDAATEVVKLPAEAIEPPPEELKTANRDYLEGIGKLDGRLVILLNLHKVLSLAEIAAASQVADSTETGPSVVEAE